MNYRKYTYESDFESQKDAFYCGNDIFSYQMKKNVNNKTLLPLGLKEYCSLQGQPAQGPSSLLFIPQDVIFAVQLLFLGKLCPRQQ